MVALLKEVRAAWAALHQVALEAGQRVVACARQSEQFSDLRAIHKNRLLSAIPLCTIVCQNQ